MNFVRPGATTVEAKIRYAAKGGLCLCLRTNMPFWGSHVLTPLAVSVSFHVQTGHVADFKKGPFHLQKDTQADIQVAVIKGAYELWPPGQVFSSTGQVRRGGGGGGRCVCVCVLSR